MTLRALTLVPDPLLRQVAEPVADIDDTIRTLLSDMAETMYDAPGIGLAAPQVGIFAAIFAAIFATIFSTVDAAV